MAQEHAEKIAVIHTGFFKTGSSSIQHSLAHNRGLLAERGYLYPKFVFNGAEFYNRSVPLFGVYCENPERFQHYWYHNQLEAGYVNNELEKLFQDDLWNRNKLIFSDEFVSGLSKQGLIRLRDNFFSKGFKLRVISFVREPFSLMVSLGQQGVYRRPIKNTLSGYDFKRVGQKVEALQDVFGDAAEFYSFEETCLHPSGPVGFFFDLLGIALMPERVLRINEGMSQYSTRLLSYINEQAPMLKNNTEINPIRQHADTGLLEKIPGGKFQLNKDEVESIKPGVMEARQSIEAVLGKGFLPPLNLACSGSECWGEEQMDFILYSANKLDLHIMLRVNDYLWAQELEGAEAEAKRDVLTNLLRERLDRERPDRVLSLTKRYPMLRRLFRACKRLIPARLQR
tara:strand:- start:34783 stop:35976 length:1194 start_codon:yes stop_codon:yes gene_type:complete